MVKPLFRKVSKLITDSIANGIIETKVFKNINNKQFNLPVMKRHTSPQIIREILENKNVIGLKFKITDVIFKNNRKEVEYNG